MAYKKILALVFFYHLIFSTYSLQGGGPSVNSSSSVATRRSMKAKLKPYVFHVAGYYADGKYYGGRARINLWRITSTAYDATTGVKIVVWFGNGTLEAGFHVYKRLYNDNGLLRFFTHWTPDRYNKRAGGCYNTYCEGFVLALNPGTHPGHSIAPLSEYDGGDYCATISIQKDQSTGNWMLYRDDADSKSLIGWWPGSLIPNSDYATRIQWTGFVGAPNDIVFPPMGSGHFASEGWKKAAYFKNMMVYNSKIEAYELDHHDEFDTDVVTVKPFVNRPECYTVSEYGYADGDGMHFYYGGPPRCP